MIKRRASGDLEAQLAHARHLSHQQIASHHGRDALGGAAVNQVAGLQCQAADKCSMVSAMFQINFLTLLR